MGLAEQQQPLAPTASCLPTTAQVVVVEGETQLREAHAVQKEMDSVLGRSKDYTGSSSSSHLLSHRSQTFKRH